MPYPLSACRPHIQPSSEVPPSLLTGLLAYWRLEEASGNRVDSSGNGHTLVPAGTIARVTGKVGFGIRSDSDVNQWLDAATPATLSVGGGSFTISLWFNTSEISDDHEILFYGKGYPDPPDFAAEYRLLWHDQIITFRVNDNGVLGGETVELDLVPSDGWHLIQAWFDADTERIYIAMDNGTAVSAACSAITPILGLGFRLGDSIPDRNGPALSVDEVGIWNRMLTSEERAALYNGGDGLAWPLTYTVLDVATNNAKLSLTGISVGQLVRVTGESNRIERYTGPDATVVAVLVTGAGTLAANGVYIESGTSGGRPQYLLLGGTVDDRIGWTGGEWAISSGGDTAYFSDDVISPWLATTWTTSNGAEPPPEASSLTQGAIDAGLTIAGAGVSPVSGLPEVNGVYTKRGTHTHMPFYNKVGHATTTPGVDAPAYCPFANDDGRWQLADSEDAAAFMSNELFVLPWEATYFANDSNPPAPTVTRNDIASEANWEVVS